MPARSDWNPSPPSARKLFVVTWYVAAVSSSTPLMRTFDTGFGAPAQGVSEIAVAVARLNVYVSVLEGSSTTCASATGPHHWSLSTSRSWAPVNVFVVTMLLNGWTVKASP